MNLIAFSIVLSLSYSTAALAQASAPAAPSSTTGLLLNLPIFIAIFALLYFSIIRPQKNQQKKHAEFISKLTKGEEVVTSSGILGKIVGITDRVITLEISQGTEIKILRSQVQGYLKDSVTASAQTT